MPIPDRNMFEDIYSRQPPWEIGRPQKAFVEVADQVTGAALDAGCGTGENALYFAGRGHDVTGIDFLERPIQLAREKAKERGIAATFLVMDALALEQLSKTFDSVIDSGLFHVFSDEDRSRYVKGLESAIKPGGRLFMMCFSDEEPGEQGPRRISRKNIEQAFASGWVIESIRPSRFEIRDEFKDAFSKGGPKTWFAVIRRVA
ncbi:MAG TPA: class I SAM-dependent methyltransferase [Terriglobia bacterium]|nr:class I SAM-dependent methyltransferase [Terriglobia bacterium]